MTRADLDRARADLEAATATPATPCLVFHPARVADGLAAGVLSPLSPAQSAAHPGAVAWAPGLGAVYPSVRA